jgi:hypothetical protein
MPFGKRPKNISFLESSIFSISSSVLNPSVSAAPRATVEKCSVRELTRVIKKIIEALCSENLELPR